MVRWEQSKLVRNLVEALLDDICLSSGMLWYCWVLWFLWGMEKLGSRVEVNEVFVVNNWEISKLPQCTPFLFAFTFRLLKLGVIQPEATFNTFTNIQQLYRRKYNMIFYRNIFNCILWIILATITIYYLSIIIYLHLHPN